MISILHPEIIHHLQGLDYGLMPIYLPKEDKFILAIKATKECILTAKFNNEFKVYLIKSPVNSSSHLGLVVAFFDDHDEPLTITTPLFLDDILLTDIARLFSQPNFDTYFFDENNYELFGARAENGRFERFSKEISVSTFPRFQHSEILSTWKNIELQFGMRTKKDDTDAYEVKLNDRFFPDDVMITDVRETFYGFNDDGRNLSVISLERDGDPGPMQEKGIAKLLRKVFERKEIFLNPDRADTGRELTDILIVTDNVIGTSKNFQFLGRPFLALLVRWAKRPEHRVRGSDWLSA